MEIQHIISNLRQKHQKKITGEEFSKFEKIYHYTNPQSFHKILSSKKLWFSDVTYLNDESEVSYTYNLAKNLIYENKDILDQDFEKSILEEINNKLIEKEPESSWQYIHKRSFYIASFSNNPDNLLLWSYYTKNQKMAGYNIGFNKNIIHKISYVVLGRSKYFSWGNVIYKKDIQNALLKDALLDYNTLIEKTINKEDKKNIIDSFKGYLFVTSLFFKQDFFEQENEYRIVIDNYIDPLLSKEIVYENKFREQNNFMIPYIEIDFIADDIESVTISPTIKQEYYQKSIKRMLVHYDYYKASKNVSNSAIPLRY